MGLGNSMPIQRTMTLRQATEPGNPIEGMLWVDTSGNNVERKQWDGSRWELDVAVGPDTPEHSVEGARWSKTDTDEVLVHDGTNWISIGVSDHANLSNVTASQHHARPIAGTGLGEDASGNFNTLLGDNLGTDANGNIAVQGSTNTTGGTVKQDPRIIENKASESASNLIDEDTATYVSLDTDTTDYVIFNGDGHRIVQVQMYVNNGTYDEVFVRDPGTNVALASVGTGVSGWVTRTVNHSGPLKLGGNAYGPKVYELNVIVEKTAAHNHSI